MLNFVWDQERALEVRAEEAMEEGMEKGMEKGRQEGRQEGMEKGMEKGREKERVFSIHNMMEELGLSLERAMDVLKIPMGERAKYAMMVKG